MLITRNVFITVTVILICRLLKMGKLIFSGFYPAKAVHVFSDVASMSPDNHHQRRNSAV